MRRDRRIRELERDVQREEEERADEERSGYNFEAAKSQWWRRRRLRGPFSPTILRQSVSLEPSALLTASTDVQPEPSALTGSVDEGAFSVTSLQF